MLALLKTLDGNADRDASGTVVVGDTLIYLLSMSNAGNVTLTDLTVNDPLPGLGAIDCGAPFPLAALAPGTTPGCTATCSAQATDTGIVNTATANSDQCAPVNSSLPVNVERNDVFLSQHEPGRGRGHAVQRSGHPGRDR